MFQLLLYYFKIIQYQVFYYFMGVFAVFDDLQNRSFNKFDIVNKRGKVAVVTGGARGIGLEVVRKLIECEMHVIIGCRDVKAGQRAIQQHISTDASIEIYALDLKSFTSVKHFTQQILTKHDQIHLLINNAGVMAVPFEKCEDGFEAHWTVNYLSHFLLTELLLPVLKMSGLEDEKARIVNVSSCAHELSPIINFEMINNSQGYIRNAAYAKSKLAQIMLTKYYNKKLSNTNVRVLAVHPGVVNTELFKDTFLKMTAPWILRFICKTPEEGARSIAYASVSPRLEGCGGYYGNCQPLKNLPYADDEETQKKLYDTSMAMFYRIVCTVSYIASAILYYVLLRNLSSRCYGRGAYVKCSISPHCYWIAVRIVLAVYFVVIPFQPSTFKQPWESKLQIGEIYWRPRVAGSTVNSYNVYVRLWMY